MAYPCRSTASAFVADASRAALFVATFALWGCSTDLPVVAIPDDGSTDSRDGATDAARADAGGVTPAPEGEPFETLAEWHLFTDAAKQQPSERVVPYEVNSQLFADYAAKRRFIYLPVGLKIGYSPTETWDLPVGTILVKTFSYHADARYPSKGERLLETRLLIHQSDGWTPRTYVWDAEQKSATLERGGHTIDSQFVDSTGAARTNAYAVPSENDCRGCHGKLGVTNSLGGKTLQLDRDNNYGSGPENQIDHLNMLGFFSSTPEPNASRVRLVDPFGSGDISDRARSYFEGNCAHCHKPGNFQASSSGLWLDWASTAPTAAKNHWGYCKDRPSAAGGGTCGLLFDIVPGKPDESILICRTGSTKPKEKMPTIGRNLVHTEGVELLSDWIRSLTGACGKPARVPDAGSPDSGDAAIPTDGSPRDSSSPADASTEGG